MLTVVKAGFVFSARAGFVPRRPSAAPSGPSQLTPKAEGTAPVSSSLDSRMVTGVHRAQSELPERGSGCRSERRWCVPPRNVASVVRAGWLMRVQTEFFIILKFVPAYYTSSNESTLTRRTSSRAAVQSFMAAGSLTLGGNMSVAAGPLGRNGSSLPPLSSRCTP